MNVFIIITIIMSRFSDEFLCLIIAVLQRPLHSAKNTIQDKTLNIFFSMKMVKCTKDEYWHRKWAIGRFSSQKLEKLLSAHVN